MGLTSPYRVIEVLGPAAALASRCLLSFSTSASIVNLLLWQKICTAYREELKAGIYFDVFGFYHRHRILISILFFVKRDN